MFPTLKFQCYKQTDGLYVCLQGKLWKIPRADLLGENTLQSRNWLFVVEESVYMFSILTKKLREESRYIMKSSD